MILLTGLFNEIENIILLPSKYKLYIEWWWALRRKCMFAYRVFLLLSTICS